MLFQMSLLSEGGVAEGAFERPQVLVHPHVRFEVVTLFEPLATYLAVLKSPLASLIIAADFTDLFRGCFFKVI